jgi:integrase/recombinase XerD
MINLKVILDTRKPKTNGTCPIYYRITERKKVAYIYSGFSIEQSQWNDSKNQVKKSHPNAQTINTSISKRYFELQKAVVELEDEELFSLNSLKEKVAPKTEIKTVKELADILITEMFAKNRTGNAIVYRTGVNNLFKFKPSKVLRFTDIDVPFIEKYKDWLTSNGCKVNTIGNYLRTLRAIYNKAIKLKIVDRKYYPFSDISIKTEKTAKRAFTKATIVSIENLYLLDNSPVRKARDYYMLSFYFIGMNFTDVAYLKLENISNDRIEYRRRKTGHQYNIKILPKASSIINEYSSDGRYIFPILPDDIVENSLKAKRLIQQWIKTTNKYLKRISEILELDKPCTTYTVRHSWATIAKRLGYSKELIGEALGHQQGNQVTEIYLDKFDKELIDDINWKVSQ